jgi:hypothetical protein
VADCTAADALLDQMPATSILHGDKGYDSNAVRQKIEDMGAATSARSQFSANFSTERTTGK